MILQKKQQWLEPSELGWNGKSTEFIQRILEHKRQSFSKLHMKTSRRLTVWVIQITCYSRAFAVLILFCFGKNILQKEECWCPWIMTITQNKEREHTLSVPISQHAHGEYLDIFAAYRRIHLFNLFKALYLFMRLSHIYSMKYNPICW